MKISMKFHVSLKEIALLQEEDVYGSSMGSREKMENVLESLSVSAKKIQKCCENCALIRSLKLKIQVFDHNFTRSARIELRFWEVANLEKLNNFYHGHL